MYIKSPEQFVHSVKTGIEKRLLEILR